MENVFVYKIKIEGFLTSNEAQLIYNCLKAHKDTDWYAQEGQFGFELVNYYKGKDFTRTWSAFEIDTVLKSFEGPVFQQDKGAFEISVRDKLWEWFKAIRTESRRLNAATTPLTTEKLKEFTGLDSWLQLYRLLTKNGQTTGVVELKNGRLGTFVSPESLTNEPVWEVDMDALKVAAFEEVIDQLPD